MKDSQPLSTREVVQHAGAAQVLAGLAIALCLGLVWMRSDAIRTKRRFWPWALLTLVAGSFGPLLYLLLRKPDQASLPTA